MKSATETPKIEGSTILVVDDTPANLELAITYLEEHNFEVAVAQAGEDAIKRAQLIVPDLILLDVMMPGLDGFETCRRLKAIDRTCEIPVIFMIALTDLRDKVARFSAGGVDYITKPFEIEELLARVRTHLTLRAIQQQLVAKNAQLQTFEIRYRRLFETARDGILLLDQDSGHITDVNESLIRMLGYGRAHFVGHPLWDVPPFDDIPNCRSLFDALHASEHVRSEHASLKTAEGSSLDVELMASVYSVDAAKTVQCNVRDITERKQAESRMRYMALHDALTGLPNRILLRDRLRQAIDQARRSQKRVAALMLALDRFKHINHSLGHDVGDSLLEATSRRLRACVRESDILARPGGDEFVIGLPENDDDREATEVAQKVLATLARPFQLNGHELHVGCSIGISRYPADGQDAEALLRAADMAMYDAKANGRGIHSFFTPELNEAAQRHLILGNDVRHACERGEFVLHYQPQVCAHSGDITGVEALLRWQHPEHGQILPVEFVPMLEELGLMVAVGQWVLQTACRQNEQWQREGLAPVRMAVNLSAQQFRRGNMVQTVDEVLRATGLAAEWLELELTETMALDDTESAIIIMHDLKRLGVSLSLDDFGTGWSSLSHLRQFPLDRLKIDRSFIRDVVTQPSASTVVQGVLTLANNLGIGCVAEGVETIQQLEYLQEQQCSEIQGFLFSPAVPASECAALLLKEREGQVAQSTREIEHVSGSPPR